MTRKEIIDGLKYTVDMFLFNPTTGETFTEPRNDMDKTTIDACRGAIELLEQEPCEDAISRKAVQDYIAKYLSQYLYNDVRETAELIDEYIGELPSVKPQEPKTGHCKECKYFEYDSVAKVDGIPLIVAHEICNKWGDGCKTKEDGYCFLFEPQESEVSE